MQDQDDNDDENALGINQPVAAGAYTSRVVTDKRSKKRNKKGAVGSKKTPAIYEKDQQIRELSESLVKAREEQFEFDYKMQQVTNLLKELKNNSSAAGYNTSTNNNNTGIAHQPNDEKSLKLQDLEKTTSNNHNNNNSEFIDKLRAENTQLRRRVEQLERDFDLQRGDLAN